MRDPLDPKNRSQVPTDTQGTQTASTTDLRVAACGCNKDLPCDTYRRCIAQTKQSRGRMLDEGVEGDDLRHAMAAQVAAERYNNLTSRCAAPDETTDTVASLVELYDACSEFAPRSSTDRQIELFNRVHLLLDWDERREVLRILNNVERFDGDEGARDCFAAQQESGLSISLSALFCRLCCFDNEYLARPRDFRRVCLCNNSGTCVNPQHYFTIEKQRAQPRSGTTTKRLRKRNRAELPEEDDERAEEYDKTNEIDLFASAVAEEYATNENDTEQARLAALAVCLEDQLTLQNESNRRRLKQTTPSSASPLQHQPTSKQRQQKEDYFDFAADQLFAGAKTPTLLTYEAACRTITGLDKKPGAERSPPPIAAAAAVKEEPTLPPALLVNEHCKPMANRVEQLLRARYSLDVII